MEHISIPCKHVTRRNIQRNVGLCHFHIHFKIFIVDSALSSIYSVLSNIIQCLKLMYTLSEMLFLSNEMRQKYNIFVVYDPEGTGRAYQYVHRSCV